jgi:hypothetical protein
VRWDSPLRWRERIGPPLADHVLDRGGGGGVGLDSQTGHGSTPLLIRGYFFLGPLFAIGAFGGRFVRFPPFFDIAHLLSPLLSGSGS